MKKVGFTLIETILVVSVIALILAIAIPALSAARKRTKTALCQSNIRQIGLAFELYQIDHECFPYAVHMSSSAPASGDELRDATMDWPGPCWFYYLDLAPDPYASKKSILQCPSKKYDEMAFKYNVLWGNYGVNWSICKSPIDSLPGEYREFEGKPTKLTSLRKPGQTLLLADSGYAWISWFHTLPNTHPDAITTQHKTMNQVYLPGASVNEHRDPWPVQEEDALNGRHPGKTVNCLFTDGHIENRRADDLVVRPLDHGQFENLTPLWKP